MRSPRFVGEDMLIPLSPSGKGLTGLGPISSIVGPSESCSSDSRTSSCAVGNAGDPMEDDKLFTDAASANGRSIGDVPRRLGDGDRKYGSLSLS